MRTPQKSVNAWIFLGEDDPSGSDYNTPGSSYQTLIQYGVYNYTDQINLCFVNTVPTSASTVPTGDGSTHTIQMQTADHPNGYTNQQYMEWVIADARKVNPNIKVLVTLGYADDEMTQIFGTDQSQWQSQAQSYAANLVTYLQTYDLDGFDVDWEPSFSDAGTPQQFNILFTAIRAAFDNQSRRYYLTLSPSEVGKLDGATVTACFDWVNLQLYGGAWPPDFVSAGVSQSLLAYGAKFEPDFGVPYQTAQQAYDGYTSGGYSVVTQWRLNSNNFNYEQAQQMILYQLVYGTGGPFDDTPIVGAAGNPPISQLVVRAGEVLDSIQATNAGSFESNPVTYELPQHGGNGGGATTVQIAAGDGVAQVSGYAGVWYGWLCVLQITITTQQGTVFGPYGSMAGSAGQTAFTLQAPAGQSIVAFSGTVINVPLAGGGNTDIIASLNASYA